VERRREEAFQKIYIIEVLAGLGCSSASTILVPFETFLKLIKSKNLKTDKFITSFLSLTAYIRSNPFTDKLQWRKITW
jgi:hypothetical protein